MAAASVRLEAHQKPPEQLKVLFKKYQKATKQELDNDASIIDLEAMHEGAHAGIRCVGTIQSPQRVPDNLLNKRASIGKDTAVKDGLIYEVRTLPGLLLIPSLLSAALQIGLLNRLLHRDLVNPNHKTNLHLHYDMSLDHSNTIINDKLGHSQQPQARRSSTHRERMEAQQSQVMLPRRKSFFSADLSTTFQPKDPHVHKELTVTQVLEKKLRWVTLGGQYDWTAKAYPRERPPFFPSDVAAVLKSMFPYVDPQAAILNLYSPGDTLSVHRDVSEECDRGLVSLSFGCEAIFLVGNEDGSKAETIRLRSGDALVMLEPSRFAWHGVPKVVAGTCPEWLEDWPMIWDEGLTYENWKGWMARKRINLNVRQMSELGISGCGPFNPPR